MVEEKKNGKWQGIIFAALLMLVVVFFIVRKNKKIAREHEFYAFYQNIKGLQSSSPVQLNGVRVGKISDIDLNGGGKVRVTFRLKKEIQIPDGTVALLASGNILGDKLIRLIPGPGPGVLPDESVLPSTYDTSVMKVSVQIGPYLHAGKLLLASTDTSLKSFSYFLQTHLLTKIVHGFINTEQAFRQYSITTGNWTVKGEEIVEGLADMDSSTAELAASSANLKSKLGKIEGKTTKIANNSLRQNVEGLKTSVAQFKATFSDYNNNHDSGLGKLVNRKDAYNNMTNNLDTMNRNMKETYEHPTGFSIFGGKKKKK